VIPYCMGPIDSPYARCGVEITDSPYVVANMYLMTRIGKPALTRIEKDKTFVKGLHSTGELDPARRFIVHFPEELTIMSFGSGYGGNALLGKKCHALRIASFQARTEGWLAEHMLIVGVQNPAGDIHYLACAFPSACGKTNLAMLIPPASHAGWKVWTLGDDIAWMHLDANGQLRAINPEAGYFGVVPGTNPQTNRNAYDMIGKDTIFTNVGVTANNDPWWEEKGSGEPTTDWKGDAYTKANGPAAHPNARFTVSAKQNPSYSKLAEAPEGVPISALVFGGRRRELAPLVYQAKDWAHGVLVGASVASETTAAATGKVGVVRRDPMAMKPFCGYNYGDYWAHWLSFGKRSSKLPKIFHVNWFRRDASGKFLWPGFGDNLRVLRWIIDRCLAKVDAIETPIGFLPKPGDIDVKGLDVSTSTLEQLLAVDPEQWRKEMASIGEYFGEFGDRLPAELAAEHQKVVRALG
jgi:phosphoenolpyruvate carboxykinase (GTP)